MRTAVVQQQASSAETVPLVQAVDVSNWQGELWRWWPTLRKWGVERVVVRLSTERPQLRTIAQRQLLQASEAGYALDGYVWCYWDLEPEALVGAALDVVAEAGVQLTYVWLDLEEPPGSVDVVGWVRRAADAIASRGYRPGVYTGPWWTSQYLPDSRPLHDLPLWVAHYDGDPRLETAPTCGWPRVHGKQWTDHPLDRDVFARELFR